jgi:hypothetical protein
MKMMGNVIKMAVMMVLMRVGMVNRLRIIVKGMMVIGHIVRCVKFMRSFEDGNDANTITHK